MLSDSFSLPLSPTQALARELARSSASVDASSDLLWLGLSKGYTDAEFSWGDGEELHETLKERKRRGEVGVN